jgi:hypothetical protein
MQNISFTRVFITGSARIEAVQQNESKTQGDFMVFQKRNKHLATENGSQRKSLPDHTNTAVKVQLTLSQVPAASKVSASHQQSL